MKITKNMTITMNILIISHLFEVMPLKALRSSVCAASTLSCVSPTLESILGVGERRGEKEGREEWKKGGNRAGRRKWEEQVGE